MNEFLGHTEQEFKARLDRHYDELKWLYFELYSGRAQAFDELLRNMYAFYQDRKDSLKELDRVREQNPGWYRKNNLLAMTMDVNAFANTLKGVQDKLDYVASCHVGCLHLMPLLKSPEGRSDNGSAVADFRTVQPELGTMEDLAALADECHGRGISLCMDFVMNHTSEEHEWAKRARSGEKEYMDRYYFYDTYDLPAQFERTVPQALPAESPGNFTWLPDMEKFVMTTFYPYQWDLNYWNPIVLNEMIYNMLYLASQGIDIIRVDAVPYIWKQLGTNCRSLPQVHTVLRILRMISEIICPGMLLLGEVLTEPESAVPYFGTIEKPECHLLYNVTTMAATWHTVATKDARLLKHQMDLINGLPKEYVFLNYLRCYDEIDWNLDYQWLKNFGITEKDHKKYLNNDLTGHYPGALGRGELYHSDPATGDAKLCGTTASLCGLEKALYEMDENAINRAVRFDITLHACMLAQSGIPMLCSGDEIGQLNDYDYHNDPQKWSDSRYLQRGSFRWDLTGKIKEDGTSQQAVFSALAELENIRASHEAFCCNAAVWTLDTWDVSILALVRAYGHEKLVAIFNFSEYDKVAWINEDDGLYINLLTGNEMEAKGVMIPAYGFYWLMKKQPEQITTHKDDTCQISTHKDDTCQISTHKDKEKKITSSKDSQQKLEDKKEDQKKLENKKAEPLKLEQHPQRSGRKVRKKALAKVKTRSDVHKPDPSVK